MILGPAGMTFPHRVHFAPVTFCSAMSDSPSRRFRVPEASCDVSCNILCNVLYNVSCNVSQNTFCKVLRGICFKPGTNPRRICPVDIFLLRFCLPPGNYTKAASKILFYRFFKSPVSSLNSLIISSILSASALTLSQVFSWSYQRAFSSSDVLPCCSTQV